jgi:hypothetical protein
MLILQILLFLFLDNNKNSEIQKMQGNKYVSLVDENLVFGKYQNNTLRILILSFIFMSQDVKYPTEPTQFSSVFDDFYKDFILLSICFQFFKLSRLVPP